MKSHFSTHRTVDTLLRRLIPFRHCERPSGARQSIPFRLVAVCFTLNPGLLHYVRNDDMRDNRHCERPQGTRQSMPFTLQKDGSPRRGLLAMTICEITVITSDRRVCGNPCLSWVERWIATAWTPRDDDLRDLRHCERPRECGNPYIQARNGRNIIIALDCFTTFAMTCPSRGKEEGCLIVPQASQQSDFLGITG